VELPPGWTSTFVRAAPRVRLHCVTAGDPSRPPIVLLHGFPEFWYAWRRQIQPLADAGFHVIAPDLRGYNLSDKPAPVAAYALPKLVQDIAHLIGASGHERATVVGHDWGGIIAWHVGMWRPEVVDRLVILNAPHPAAYRREVGRLGKQVLLSWYVLLFQLPWLPEALIRLGDFAAIHQMFREDPTRADAFTQSDVEAYVRAMRVPRSLNASLNYYRAAFRDFFASSAVFPIEKPVLLLWGEQDRALTVKLTEGLDPLVTNITIRRFPSASHWLQHDEPAEVAREIIEFARR
jgi:pimeloyl-ACP methyl ester carboxylesterase